MEEFLEATDVVDWKNPDVLALAHDLSGGAETIEAAARCFAWVRDEIKHSVDYGLDTLTCSASEVLREGSGLCYAKSHLLAALLRANGIPAALCYQRVNSSNGEYCLHGLNSVYLPVFGWYRVDPRGNRPGVEARFTPPIENLAYSGFGQSEADVPGRFAAPLPIVIQALRSHSSVQALMRNLPDIPS